MPRPFVHDQWAPLSFTDSVGDGTSRPPGARPWLDSDDARRVAVYERLAAMQDNVDRYFAPSHLWMRPPVDVRAKLELPAPAEKRREFGDAALLVQQARSFVLGDEQALIIPEADPLPDDAEEAD